MAAADKPNLAVVIPARYESSRFPGKPLVNIAGVTMIERTYKQARMCRNINTVLVATDDQRIFDVVTGFGGDCVMTRGDHPTGTDRLAEVARLRPELDIIVNVQGDEPLIDPRDIEAVAAPLIQDRSVQMSTLAFPVTDPAEVERNTLVKVVCDQSGFALYFSRHPIPFVRNKDHVDKVEYLGHMGIYAYTRECLLKLANLTPTPLETAECLEQLRAIENGIRIKVGRTSALNIAVDVPEDVAKVEGALAVTAVNLQTMVSSLK